MDDCKQRHEPLPAIQIPMSDYLWNANDRLRRKASDSKGNVPSSNPVTCFTIIIVSAFGASVQHQLMQMHLAIVFCIKRLPHIGLYPIVVAIAGRRKPQPRNSPWGSSMAYAIQRKGKKRPATRYRKSHCHAASFQDG